MCIEERCCCCLRKISFSLLYKNIIVIIKNKKFQHTNASCRVSDSSNSNKRRAS